MWRCNRCGRLHDEDVYDCPCEPLCVDPQGLPLLLVLLILTLIIIRLLYG